MLLAKLPHFLFTKIQKDSSAKKSVPKSVFRAWVLFIKSRMLIIELCVNRKLHPYITIITFLLPTTFWKFKNVLDYICVWGGERRGVMLKTTEIVLFCFLHMSLGFELLSQTLRSNPWSNEVESEEDRGVNASTQNFSEGAKRTCRCVLDSGGRKGVSKHYKREMCVWKCVVFECTPAFRGVFWLCQVRGMWVFVFLEGHRNSFYCRNTEE